MKAEDIEIRINKLIKLNRQGSDVSGKVKALASMLEMEINSQPDRIESLPMGGEEIPPKQDGGIPHETCHQGSTLEWRCEANESETCPKNPANVRGRVRWWRNLFGGK